MMKNEKLNSNPAGPAFEELTLEEMIASQGSGDVKPQTTPTTASSAACSLIIETITYATISYATKKCS